MRDEPPQLRASTCSSSSRRVYSRDEPPPMLYVRSSARPGVRRSKARGGTSQLFDCNKRITTNSDIFEGVLSLRQSETHRIQMCRSEGKSSKVEIRVSVMCIVFFVLMCRSERKSSKIEIELVLFVKFSLLLCVDPRGKAVK